MTIRTARPEDAEAFYRIKMQLPMPLTPEGETGTGGFLLGADPATYRAYIEHADCLVAESDGDVIGFGIVFPDALVRASEIWQKRESVAWAVDISEYENRQLCYFEQLAFLPGRRKWAVALGYHLIRRAFEAGCEALFTTTVREPVLNTAALPFLHAAGGFLAGNLDEQYPEVGRINSDVHIVEREVFFEKAQARRVYDFLGKTGVE